MDWIKNKIFKNLIGERIILVLFLFNIIILFLHLFKFPYIRVDNITIFLIIIVLLTPFATHIKKIKWGEFEAELGEEVRDLKQKAEEFEDFKEQPDTISTDETTKNELIELLKKDRLLALAKLRIEIEIRLKKLFFNKNDSSVHGIRSMTQTLAATGKINTELRIIILDITSILNRAIHGADLADRSTAEEVVDIGIEILNELDYIYYNEILEPRSKKIITKKELKKLMKSQYKITSAVPLVKKPYLNERLLNQEQLEQFLDGYDEFAEFLIGIEKVE